MPPARQYLRRLKRPNSSFILLISSFTLCYSVIVDRRNPIDLFNRGRVKWLRYTPGVMALAAVLAVSLTLYFGRSPVEKPLTLSSINGEDYPRGGAVKMVWDSTLSFSPPSTMDARDLFLEFDIIPTWIGQIFIRLTTDGQTSEAFVTGAETVREAGRLQHFEITIAPDKLIIRHAGVGWEKPFPRHPGTIRDIEIISHESVFDLDNFSIKDWPSKNLLYRENFGRKLTDLPALLILFLALILALFLTRQIEHWIFKSARLDSRQDSVATFFAGCLPFSVALGFIDTPLRSDALGSIAAATVMWRLAILPRAFWRRKTIALFALLALPASLTVAAMLGQGDLARWDASAICARLLALGFIALISLLEIFFWRHSGKLNLPAAMMFTSMPLIFLALPAFPPFSPTEPTDYASLAALAFIAMAAAKFSFLQLPEKPIKAYPLLVLMTLALFLTGAEISLRHSTFSASWRSQNVGGNFKEDQLLFWIPKNWISPDVDFHMRRDFAVEKINFRSGKVSRKKPEGVFRILLMGGSNVWGDRLDHVEDTLAYKLEKKLNGLQSGVRYEVVNAGVCGYNLFQLLVLHESYLKTLQYDLLVLYIGLMDAAVYDETGPFTLRELWTAKNNGNWDEIENFMSARGLWENRRWIIGAQKVLRRFNIYNGLTKAVVNFRGGRVAKDLNISHLKRINPVEDFVGNLKDITASARQRNADVVFATEFMWEKDPSMAPPEDNPVNIIANAMKSAAKGIDVPLCDTHARMTGSGSDLDELVFSWDTSHLSPKGTDLLSDLMIECFDVNDLL